MSSLFRIVLALALISTAHAQQVLNNGQPQSLTPVPIQIGHATLNAEIAATEQQGEIGLMYRHSMPDNAGMLFVLPVQRAVFWMENTYIPLSIAFLDKDGTVLELHDMKALDLSHTVSDSDLVAYALEANLHWFDLNGIKPGMKIDPPPAVLVQEATHAAAH
jgi:uncharacterized membrane protein (UPF0127 family)